MSKGTPADVLKFLMELLFEEGKRVVWYIHAFRQDIIIITMLQKCSPLPMQPLVPNQLITA